MQQQHFTFRSFLFVGCCFFFTIALSFIYIVAVNQWKPLGSPNVLLGTNFFISLQGFHNEVQSFLNVFKALTTQTELETFVRFIISLYSFSLKIKTKEFIESAFSTPCFYGFFFARKSNRQLMELISIGKWKIFPTNISLVSFNWIRLWIIVSIKWLFWD